MEKGQAVYQNYHGIRRYGIVDGVKTKGEWKYATVVWFNDEIYERSMADLAELRSGTLSDFAVYEYRLDSLEKVDLKRELDALKAMREYQKKTEGA
jgi:hypothetical protein